jgi:coproporphyrinogen III oxidase-like Fe-S oxidoreductase
MEGYFELVVDMLVGAGYRWYETSNFCVEARLGGGRDLRARHNLAYWRARDYLGIGIGAVSTVHGVRRRNKPSLAAYVGALRAGAPPPREIELLDDETRARERLLLGLRLDEPLRMETVDDVVDASAAEQLAVGGLVDLGEDAGSATLTLTRRGRFLGGGVTAELLELAET